MEVAWSVDGDSDPSCACSGRSATGRRDAAARKGFGTTLIQRSVSFEMDGEADLQFDREGVRCELIFPLTGCRRKQAWRSART